LAYVDQGYKLDNGGRSKKSALEVAREQLDRSLSQAYEPELRRLYGQADLTVLLGDVFERQCQELLQTVWNDLQQRA
jgi:exodeoxyribonuclease V gamma subunit